MNWFEFILQLTKEIMPVLTLLTAAIIAWQNTKAKAERHEIATHLKKVEVAVDGITRERVASAQVAGFDEGSKLEAGRSASPEAEAKAVARSDELTEASRAATAKTNKDVP